MFTSGNTCSHSMKEGASGLRSPGTSIGRFCKPKAEEVQQTEGKPVNCVWIDISPTLIQYGIKPPLTLYIHLETNQHLISSCYKKPSLLAKMSNRTTRPRYHIYSIFQVPTFIRFHSKRFDPHWSQTKDTPTMPKRLKKITLSTLPFHQPRPRLHQREPASCVLRR